MSELSNPLFENEREFLERQKEEYKKALMGDVDHLKTQSQEIGKKVAIAGGVLVAGLLLRRMFSGSKKKAERIKKNKKEKTTYTPPVSASFAEYDSLIHEQEDAYTLASDRALHNRTTEHENGKTTGKSESKSFLQSDIAQFLAQQATALLMVYITKKAEEYINSVSENSDIAPEPAPVAATETTAYTTFEQNAL